MTLETNLVVLVVVVIFGLCMFPLWVLIKVFKDMDEKVDFV